MESPDQAGQGDPTGAAPAPGASGSAPAHKNGATPDTTAHAASPGSNRGTHASEADPLAHASVATPDAAAELATPGPSGATPGRDADPPSPEANSGASRRSAALRIVPALILIVIAVWEIVATRRDATSVPGDAAWAEAATVVRAGYRPGDLIVFAPDWIDPVGRLHLGDLIPIDVAARMDAARFGRIWEVAIRGAHAPDVAGLAPVATDERSGIAIRRYERAPVEVISDVRDQLVTARVDGAGRAPTVELAEVGFAPHRCLQVVPGAGHVVRVTFPALALGTQLVGYVGIADVFTRRDDRAQAQLDVEIAGRVIAHAAAGVDDGWVRFAAPTTPGVADVTFVASSASASRLICVAAEARK